VLNYKTKIEEALQIELAALKEVCIREEMELSRLEAHHEDTSQQLRAFQSETRLDLDLIRLTMAYLETLSGRIGHQAELVAQARERVETKRQELVRAVQERKVLEKLRERYLAQQAEAERRKEARTNDEIGITLHHLVKREQAQAEEWVAT